MFLMSSDSFQLDTCWYHDRVLPVCKKVFPLECSVIDSVTCYQIWKLTTN